MQCVNCSCDDDDDCFTACVASVKWMAEIPRSTYSLSCKVLAVLEETIFRYKLSGLAKFNPITLQTCLHILTILILFDKRFLWSNNVNFTLFKGYKQISSNNEV